MEIRRNIGIKNFFVRTETVKGKSDGLIKYLNYLEDETHPNHKNKTEEIISIHKSRKSFCIETIEKVKSKEYETKKRRKGGSSIQSYRQSFVYSFPKGVKPTKNQRKEVISILLLDLCKNLELSREKLLENCFINIHRNENYHINIVVNKVIDGKVLDMTKKKLLNSQKDSFNLRHLKVMNIDKDKYTHNYESPKVKTSRWLEKLKLELKEEIKEDYKTQETYVKKILKRYFTYLNRYNSFKEQKDIVKIEQHKRYINKAINDMTIEPIKKEMIKNLDYDYPSM